MTRAKLKAALKRDRDEKAEKYARSCDNESGSFLQRELEAISATAAKAGADSRTDDILDLVEALEKVKRGPLEIMAGGVGTLVDPPNARQVTVNDPIEVATAALKKLYAKYGGGK